MWPGGGLGAEEIAFGVDDLALTLGEKLLLGAEPVAAIGGEPFALAELGFCLDELRRPLAELPGLLGESQGALLDNAECASETLVDLLLLGAELLDGGRPFE